MSGGNSENCFIPMAARGLRVLVVDQDNVSLIYIASVLEEQFYNVRTTELASVALSILEERNDEFDLVMADTNMGEMDVFTFLNRLQLKTDLPIIFMSVHENIDLARKALNEGACFFLQKPMRRRDIINVWQHVYRKRIISQKIEIRRKASMGKKVAIEKHSRGKRIVKLDNFSRVSFGNENLPKGKSPLTFSRITGAEKGNQGLSIRKSGDRSESDKSNSKGSDGKDRESGSPEKRMRWTPDLHIKFMEAISFLGDKKTHPKAVLKTMNEPALTVRHVASHLQKYRDRVQRINCANQKNDDPSKGGTTYNFYGGSGIYTGLLDRINSMTPNAEFGASMPQFTSPVSLSSTGLNSGTSVHYNLETLKRALNSGKLKRNRPSSSTNNFNADNSCPNDTNPSANQKDDHQKLLEFDGSYDNFDYLGLEPDYSMRWTDELNAPNNMFHQYPNYQFSQETNFYQGQTSTCPNSNNSFLNPNYQLGQETSFFQGQTSTCPNSFQNPSYHLAQKTGFFQGQTSTLPDSNNFFQNPNYQLAPESNAKPGLAAPTSTISGVNENPSTSFADLWRLVEAQEQLEGTNGEPNLEEEDDIERYLEWFNGTPPESDNEIPK
ncbi:two-component response regulator ARR10-like [Actinidia eriantha]|uniref:two-component response regulator ARR10-like n=1 Tax=Actinidia eriantha TaxID=165200 RepID=UPI00258CFA05|nr:two-component response regulator ARR10-like [Actinidia eriantha]